MQKNCLDMSVAPWQRWGLLILLAWGQGYAAELEILDEDMSWYREAQATDPVARLNERLDLGQTALRYDETFGYLPDLLSELKVSPSSQMLVASKTSPNRLLISPTNPRALYFNFEVNVAYVPKADLLEVAAADPNLGVVFYTLEQKDSPRARLHRDDRCLECHASSKTLNVPGLLVRSFETRHDGEVDLLSGIMVTHRTPFADRWGGYYVTGSYRESLTHRGNLFGEEDVARHESDPKFHANIRDLTPFLDPTHYPSPGSDIVSLLVMDHQVHMHNLLTRLKRDAVRALEDAQNLEAATPAFETALQYMLCVEEATWPSPIAGSSAYQHWLEAQGPKDDRGRSLHQLDLRGRLFKFPCSPLIYSAAFDALPRRAKLHFYHRLWEILSGQDRSPPYQNLTEADRLAVREILVDTLPDIPVYWRL